MSRTALRRAWAGSADALTAWSRATRTVTVKETRSGSMPTARAASHFSVHSAW